jgi:hypothetical protein
MLKTKSVKRTALIALAILGITTLVSSAILKARSSSYPQSSDNSSLEVELVTLRPAAFEPAEITRPKGAFVLFIEDRSGKESSSLLLQRAGSERLQSINLQRKKSEWNDVVDLAPGAYVLQDASRPELRCQITILP